MAKFIEVHPPKDGGFDMHEYMLVNVDQIVDVRIVGGHHNEYWHSDSYCVVRISAETPINEFAFGNIGEYTSWEDAENDYERLKNILKNNE